MDMEFSEPEDTINLQVTISKLEHVNGLTGKELVHKLQEFAHVLRNYPVENIKL